MKYTKVLSFLSKMMNLNTHMIKSGWISSFHQPKICQNTARFFGTFHLNKTLVWFFAESLIKTKRYHETVNTPHFSTDNVVIWRNFWAYLVKNDDFSEEIALFDTKTRSFLVLNDEVDWGSSSAAVDAAGSRGCSAAVLSGR